MEKGDIVLVPFPFTNLKGTKTRPALILCKNKDDVILAFITTQINYKEKGDIEIMPDGTNGLKMLSLIKLTKLITLEKSLILGLLGKINNNEISLVNEKLKEILNL